jgi:starch phosphorylase
MTTTYDAIVIGTGQAVPRKWVARMRESMAQLTPVFSANRTVREYTENLAAYADRAADKGKLGQDLVAWQARIATQWQEVRFGSLKVESQNSCIRFEVPVYFGGLDPDAVRVELFAAGQIGAEPACKPMDRGTILSDGGHVYSTCTPPATRNANEFTPRRVPYHAGASVTLEAKEILWQK